MAEFDWSKRKAALRGNLREAGAERRRRGVSEIRRNERSSKIAKRRQICEVDEGVEAQALCNAALALLLHGTSSPGITNPAEAVNALRRSLSASGDPPIDAVVASGAVAVLTGLLDTPNHEIQVDILRCLTNISAGEDRHAAATLEALPLLVPFLSAGGTVVQDQAAWVLGNACAGSAELRQRVVESGALVPLTRLISTPGTDEQVLRTAAWATSNVVRPGMAPFAFFMEHNVHVAALALMAHPDDTVASEAAWIVAFLSAHDPGEESAEALLSQGAAGVLAQTLVRSEGRNPLATPVIRSLGNLTSVSSEVSAALLGDSTLLPALAQLISRQDLPRGLLKEATWTLANLGAGPADQRSFVLSHGVLGPLLQNLHTGQFDIQRESLFALRNFFEDPQVAAEAMTSEALPTVVRLMRSHDQDLVLCALSVVEVVLAHGAHMPKAVEEAGGLEALDDLNYGSPNPQIQSVASRLVDQYFGDDYGDDEIPEPSAAAAPVALGMGRGKQMTLPSWMRGDGADT